MESLPAVAKLALSQLGNNSALLVIQAILRLPPCQVPQAAAQLPARHQAHHLAHLQVLVVEKAHHPVATVVLPQAADR